MRLKVLRDGKEVTLPLTVGEIKETEVTASAQDGDFGLSVQPMTAKLPENLGLERAEGLVITAVKPASSAEEAVCGPAM